MIIQNISSDAGLKSTNLKQTKYINGNQCSFMSENDQKREAVRQQVKKIYTQGVISGAVITATVFLIDYAVNYLLDKQTEKNAKEINTDFTKDANISLESIEQASLDTIKKGKQAKKEYVPFVSIIKRIIRKIRK